MTVKAINLNRARRDLLAAVSRGQVRRAPGGQILLRTDREKRRCDGDIKAFVTIEWVRLGADGVTYELTGDGRAALDGAK